VTRWLLNTFPTWALALVLIASFVLFGVVALTLVRRLLPLRGDHNDLTALVSGVVAAVYGVFLAFAIVALYEQFHEASEDVHAEAAALEVIVRAGDGLSGRSAPALREAVDAYRDTVVGEEWDAMRDGRDSEAAWDRLDPMYRVVRDHRTRGDTDAAFHGEALAGLGTLADARRARLHAAGQSLPGALMVLVFGGAFLTLGFTVAFRAASVSAHTWMVMSLAVLLGFSLLVAVVLDHPYSGEVTVPRDPFFEGVLEDL
jgi:hypothetical protein